MMASTEREHLMRDTVSHALINKDTNSFKQRQIMKERDRRIHKLETDMANIADELKEIRSLLSVIAKRN